MKTDNIGFIEKFLQRFPVEWRIRRGLLLSGIKGEHLHAKGVSQFSNAAADPAKADYTYLFTTQKNLRRFPKRPIRGCGPLTSLHCYVMDSGMMAKFQDQGKGKLGNRVCAVFGNIGDRNTPLTSRNNIDNVITGCHDRYET